MDISILSLIFHTIPESIALVFLTLVLLKMKPNWNVILLLGVLQAVAAFLVRLLPFLEFGVHIVILILVLAGLVMCASKQKFVKVVPMALLSFIILLLFEYIIVSTFIFITDINIDVLVEDQLLWIAVTTPQWMLLFLTGFIIQYVRDRK